MGFHTFGQDSHYLVVEHGAEERSTMHLPAGVAEGSPRGEPGGVPFQGTRFGQEDQKQDESLPFQSECIAEKEDHRTFHGSSAPHPTPSSRWIISPSPDSRMVHKITNTLILLSWLRMWSTLHRSEYQSLIKAMCVAVAAQGNFYTTWVTT
jgi:hypothetical protein